MTSALIRFNPEPFDDFYQGGGNAHKTFSHENQEDMEIEGERPNVRSRFPHIGNRSRLYGRSYPLRPVRYGYPTARPGVFKTVRKPYYRPYRHRHYPLHHPGVYAPYNPVYPWLPYDPYNRYAGSDLTQRVQMFLNRVLSLDIPVDGIMNRETRSAIRMFQARAGLPVTGMIDATIMECVSDRSFMTCPQVYRNPAFSYFHER